MNPVEFSVAVEVLIFGVSSLVGIGGILWRMGTWQAEMRLRLDGFTLGQKAAEDKMDEMNQKSTERTSKIYARFDRIEDRYDELDKRLVAIETTLNGQKKQD